MAAESEWRCPICCDNQENVTYMLPCLHQFCIGCAVRWAQQNPRCPLCQSATTAIKFSVWSENDYLTFNVPGPTESVAEDHQDEQGAAGPLPRAQVGGFPPEVWADFFRSHRNNIRPLLPWMRWELLGLFEGQWWEAGTAEGLIVSHLCLWGLDEAVLVRNMQSNLGENARTFVSQLIAAAVRLCTTEIRRHVGQQDPHAATDREEHDGPASSPRPTTSHGGSPDSIPASSTSPESSNREQQASTSGAALRGGPGSPPSAPVPAEQEQPQEEPGQAAVAGPSAQGCSHSPSAPGRSRDRSTGRSRRPPKRRAPGPQDSPQPCKRPPRRQH
ncbi:TOPRS ligase, partial [Ciccaba nigrolineata]|nr:TOPRS ligase [Ciccaba nigrolineata]